MVFYFYLLALFLFVCAGCCCVVEGYRARVRVQAIPTDIHMLVHPRHIPSLPLPKIAINTAILALRVLRMLDMQSAIKAIIVKDRHLVLNGRMQLINLDRTVPASGRIILCDVRICVQVRDGRIWVVLGALGCEATGLGWGGLFLF